MKNRHTPLYRRVFAVFGACVLMAGVMLTGAGPAAAAAPFSGEACAAGAGVTVAIDFAPGTDEVKVGCAAGSQATMGDAVTAAGFSYDTDGTGLVTTMDGVLVDTSKGFWSFYLNTADGQPAGQLADTWHFAQTGITGGPLAADTVLLFDLVPDFNVTEDPRITVAEVTATAPTTGPIPAPAAPLTAPAAVVGQACLPGQGVTVAVDYAPNPDALQIGCAVGAHQDMAAAGAAAGFTFTLAGTPQFLTGIGNNGYGTPVVETGTTALPNSFWSIYINTTNGQPTEPLTSDLTSAQAGVDGGPLAIDTVLLFDFVPDYLADPPDTLRVTFADLGATAPGDAAVNPPAYSASADGDALAAAGWIGRQLEANGGVLPGAGGTDYGLTIDAIFALAAAGVGGNDIATTAQTIYQSGTAYIGASADSADNAGKIAKTTLALQVAGLDPTVFPDGAGGFRNLPEELRLAMTPDGQFGPNDFPLVHALAMLALDRTTGGVPAPAVTWLQTAQCQAPDPAAGGFGFSGCADVDVDGTSLAAQALLAAGVPSTDPSVIAAAAWLSANQQASGALLSSFGGANTNGTGLGGQTFLALGNTAAAANAGGFIGGLQVSCDSLVAGSLLTVADVGGISYDATGLQDANEFGIDSISVDQWRRASTQAILGLGLPAFDSITAAGADPELPAAPTCEPVVTTSPTTTMPTTASLATLAPVVATQTTTTGPQLVNTGVTSTTLPMTMTGLAAILIGFGLVLIARRTRSGEHG